ncbi:MAG: hypothetical protein ACXW2R_01575 [Candidatus Aminicenantales bacterium]
MPDLLGVPAIEDGETHAIEAGQPFLGRQPEIAVQALDHGADRVLRQAGIGLPDVMGVLGDSFLGIQSKTNVCLGE